MIRYRRLFVITATLCLLLASTSVHATIPSRHDAEGAACAGATVVPPSAPAVQREPFETKSRYMNDLYNRDYLDDMDDSLMEGPLIPGGSDDPPKKTSELRPEEFYPNAETRQNEDEIAFASASTDPTAGTVARQTVDGTVKNQFLTTVLDVADQGDPPAIDSLIKVEEKSSHEDRWFFYVKVYAYCGGTVVGYGQGNMVIDDTWGRNDGGSRIMEAPMKDLSVSLSDIEVLKVKLYTEHCQFGWYSGNKKGKCVEETSEESVNGIVSADLTLRIT